MKKRIDIMEEGLDNDDLYSERGIDICSDDDEINAAEEGFMRGYAQAYNES